MVPSVGQLVPPLIKSNPMLESKRDDWCDPSKSAFRCWVLWYVWLRWGNGSLNLRGDYHFRVIRGQRGDRFPKTYSSMVVWGSKIRNSLDCASATMVAVEEMGQNFVDHPEGGYSVPCLSALHIKTGAQNRPKAERLLQEILWCKNTSHAFTKNLSIVCDQISH